jgi:MIP family channel proteins
MDMTLTRNDIRAVLAELFGTLVFVLLGTSAVVSVSNADDAGKFMVIAVAHGLAILVVVGLTAKLSGGHVNPAVTLAMMFSRHIGVFRGVLYVVAQAVGAVIGSLLVKWVVPNSLEGNLGAHGLADGVAVGEGLLLEILLTFILLLVIYNVAVGKRAAVSAPVAIGLTVLILHFSGLFLTGGSFNPARSFGPAVVANVWGDFWIYILGPAIGAIAMSIVWQIWKTIGDDNLEEDAT